MSGGALLSLRDLDQMRGQPEPDRRAKITVKAEGEPVRAVGSGVSGGGRTLRNTIVRDFMRKHGSSLPAAKYVKAHMLY